MYDYVHLLKSTWNLWLTEKTGKLEFEDEGLVLTADWQHLRDLYAFVYVKPGWSCRVPKAYRKTTCLARASNYSSKKPLWHLYG